MVCGSFILSEDERERSKDLCKRCRGLTVVFPRLIYISLNPKVDRILAGGEGDESPNPQRREIRARAFECLGGGLIKTQVGFIGV